MVKITAKQALVFQGAVLLIVGVLMHYAPQQIIPYFLDAPLTKDTLAVIKGWGTAMIALGLIGVQLQGVDADRVTTHQMVARGMTVFWGMLAYGHWKMHTRASTNWGGSLPLLMLDTLFFAMDLAFAVTSTGRLSF